MVASVVDELACKSLCLRTAECKVYTYYSYEDPYEPRCACSFPTLECNNLPGLATIASPVL